MKYCVVLRARGSRGGTRTNRWCALALCAAASLAIEACQDYPFVQRPNKRVSVTKVREVVMNSPDTDILFVIDDSNSMGEEQANLINNTEAFVSEITKSENLYHIGIVTTNVLDRDRSGAPLNEVNGGRLRLVSASNVGSLCDNVETSSSPVDGSYFLKRPDLDLPADELERQRCRLVEDFRATVKAVGIDGSGTEAGMNAMMRALGGDNAFTADERQAGEATQVATQNSGFLRPGADLAIIFLTDEEDCSLEPASYFEAWGDNSTCYKRVQADLAPPPKDFVDFLASLKSATGSTDGIKKVRAGLIGGGVWEHTDGSSFVAKGCFIDGQGEPSAECGCWSSNSSNGYICEDYLGAVYGHTCTKNCGNECEALPAGRYYGFLQELSKQRLALARSPGIVVDSICQPSYYETLLKIARVLVLSNCWQLQEPILDVKAVRVEVTYKNASGAMVTDLLPRYAPGDQSACQSESQCPQGAWEKKSGTEICLVDWGIQKGPDYEFSLSVLNEEEGFDED